MDRAERVIKFIESYCRVPEGARVGEPLELAEFQKAFIRDTYQGGVRRAYLSIARKNGKSALIAALLLAHLVGPEAQPNTQIVSGARSRDQAALVFELARKMVDLNPDLKEIIRIVPSKKMLVGLLRNVEFKALAAEGKTAHGLSPVLAILDEVGQVQGPQDDFVDAITTSQGAHDSPLLIAISTQAPTDGDLFSIWLDDAQSSGDSRVVSHIYRADETAELDDPSAWSAANPALGLFRSKADVEDQAEQAKRMPAQENTFRNLVLNQRVSTVSPFVSRSVWQECASPVESPVGHIAWGGLDLSSRTDLTAFVLVFQDEDGVWHAVPRFWAPEQGLRERSRNDRVPYDRWAADGYLITTPGATVDYEHVARDILDLIDGVELQSIAYDRWRIDLMRREFERLGVDLPMQPFGQGFKDMAPALDTLEADLRNHRIAHGEHPLLTMCAANAVVSRDPAGNRKLDKAKANGRIDGMVALAMARAIAQSEDEAPVSPWEDPNFSMVG